MANTGNFPNTNQRLTNKAENRRDMKYVKVTLTNAQMLALNTTPITVVSGITNFVHIVDSVYATCPAQTTGATIGSATGIVLKYTNGSGTSVTNSMPVTGFIDQTTLQQSFAIGVTGHLPTTGAPVVAYMAGGNVTGMTGTVSMRVYYRTFPAQL